MLSLDTFWNASPRSWATCSNPPTLPYSVRFSTLTPSTSKLKFPPLRYSIAGRDVLDSFLRQRIFAGSQLCESIFLFLYPYSLSLSLSPTQSDHDYTVPTNWVAGCGYCYLLPISCRLRAKWQIRPTHSVSTPLCLWLQFAPHSIFSIHQPVFRSRRCVSMWPSVFHVSFSSDAPSILVFLFLSD